MENLLYFLSQPAIGILLTWIEEASVRPHPLLQFTQLHAVNFLDNQALQD